MAYRVIIFLILNFTALWIGSHFTSNGVPSDWYITLNKAPWTPPGWVFGAAWTTIMVCFAFYMAYAWNTVANRNQLIGLFIVQWVLNILWNPMFFKYHEVFFGLIVISALTLLIGYFLIRYWDQLYMKTLLILPNFLWLLIAISLNAYILMKN